LRYALLLYSNIETFDQTPDEERRRINAGVVEVLERPNVSGWLRLQDVESATTLHYEPGRTLLTDGPFVDSKDFLGGFIVVEADDLDGALALAGELQELRRAGAIEIRPVREDDLVGAHLHPVSNYVGELFISCVSTEYYLHGGPMTAAVLLDARHPAPRPGHSRRKPRHGTSRHRRLPLGQPERTTRRQRRAGHPGRPGHHTTRAGAHRPAHQQAQPPRPHHDVTRPNSETLPRALKHRAGRRSISRERGGHRGSLAWIHRIAAWVHADRSDSVGW
jgi:hypothetical protein